MVYLNVPNNRTIAVPSNKQLIGSECGKEVFSIRGLTNITRLLYLCNYLVVDLRDVNVQLARFNILSYNLHLDSLFRRGSQEERKLVHVYLRKLL